MRLQRTMSASRSDVREYVDLIGDHNPLHRDENYVARDDTFSDELIVPGAMIAGWFSGIINDIGDSARIQAQVVLTSMNTTFKNPLPVGYRTNVTARIPHDQMPDGSGRSELTVYLDASSTNDASGVTYAHGTARILLDEGVSQRVNN